MQFIDSLGIDTLVERIGTASPIVLIVMALVGLAFVVLVVMWLLLPFAIYGLKKRLNAQIAVTESVRIQLEQMQIRIRNNQEPPISFSEFDSEPRIREERKPGVATDNVAEEWPAGRAPSFHSKNGDT